MRQVVTSWCVRPRAVTEGVVGRFRLWGMSALSDPRHEFYLQWLTTAPQERELKTHDQVGAHLNVARRTLYDWRRSPEFVREWEKRALQIAGDPERTQRVLDALYEQALDSESGKQVQAARAWADIAGVIKPKKAVDAPQVDAMSAAEIDALLEELLRAKGEGVTS
jgi:AcrR family transcriptional regulator